MQQQSYCKVCGYRLNYNPWGEDGKSPDYSFCPSCGVEFGNQDYNLDSIKKYREEWLTSGMKWAGGENEIEPEGWDPSVQINNIPKEYI